MNPAASSLQTLRDALAALRSDTSTVSGFCQTARNQADLFAKLPPKFEEVWLQLVDRLESSALFSEESCSFSQTDLLDSLSQVLEKAQSQLKS